MSQLDFFSKQDQGRNDGVSFESLLPKNWIIVGTGVSREEVKRSVDRARGWVGEAVLDLPSFCLQILERPRDSYLSNETRQEVVRSLLMNRQLSKYFPELRRLKRQRLFLKKLDRSLQAGRMTFSHEEERSVLHERLSENEVREEVARFRTAYEAWMRANHYSDLPMLMSDVVARLEKGWPESVAPPKKIQLYQAKTIESLETSFWEVVEKHLVLEKQVFTDPSNVGKVDWRNWHTLDDAAEGLADDLEDLSSEELEDAVVLIDDSPVVKRSLDRALEERGIPVIGDRDLTETRINEKMKTALLPMEVVARNFERKLVLEWIRSFEPTVKKEWANEVNARGIRHHLGAYQGIGEGAELGSLYEQLKILNERFRGKKTLLELKESFLLEWAERTEQGDLWILSFLSTHFDRLYEDVGRIEGRNVAREKRAPLLYWLERLRFRIEQSFIPTEPSRYEKGLRIFRAHQRLPESILAEKKKVFVFGLPASWLLREPVGDYWFSEVDRDTLASEFLVRSRRTSFDERVSALRAWLVSGKGVFYDYSYDPDGRERESLAVLFKEILSPFGDVLPEREDRHSARRWQGSYSAVRPKSPQSVRLKSLGELLHRGVEATALDRYSKCGFQGLGGHRWRLRDLREPEIDLWPDSKGVILHKAVELLLSERNPNGIFSREIDSALNEAWELRPPRGLIHSPRVEAYVKKRLLKILEIFCEQERLYARRSKTSIFRLEDPDSVEMEFDGIRLRGRPDRIDQHEDGLFVMDYKTSSQVASGHDMVREGYALQLPFYCLAVAEKYRQPMLGAQFIQLLAKGSRTRGIFLKKYNGKEAGNLTQTRARLSLFEGDGSELWMASRDHLKNHLKKFVDGEFEAQPKKPADCTSCVYQDLCGRRRVVD